MYKRQAQITAVADDGGYVDNITITVKGSGKELTGITLDSSSISLKPEETKTLTATLQPEGAQASLTWKSSDDSIVCLLYTSIFGVVVVGGRIQKNLAFWEKLPAVPRHQRNDRCQISARTVSNECDIVRCVAKHVAVCKNFFCSTITVFRSCREFVFRCQLIVD